jgi:hypothetical protein
MRRLAVSQPCLMFVANNLLNTGINTKLIADGNRYKANMIPDAGA